MMMLKYLDHHSNSEHPIYRLRTSLTTQPSVASKVAARAASYAPALLALQESLGEMHSPAKQTPPRPSRPSNVEARSMGVHNPAYALKPPLSYVSFSFARR